MFKFFKYWFLDYPASKSKHPADANDFLDLIYPGQRSNLEIDNKVIFANPVTTEEAFKQSESIDKFINELNKK